MLREFRFFSLLIIGLTVKLIAANEDPANAVIAVGLPKSGSTSLTKFLNSCCGKLRAIHLIAPNCSNVRYPIPAVHFNDSKTLWNTVRKQRRCFIGVLIQQAIVDGKPPLKYVLTERVHGVVQMDTTLDELNIWPQLDALEMILDAYPNAKYVHHIRDTASHVASIMAWRDFAAQLHRKGMLSRFVGRHPRKSMEENIASLVLASRKLVRLAFLRRPHLRYIEVDIAGDLEAGAKLSIFLGSHSLLKFPHANRNRVQSSRSSG